LTLPELIDRIAVNLYEPACLDLRHRLYDEDDIREICPGLIDVGTEIAGEIQIDADEDSEAGKIITTVRIAHFSIQEYLESDHIKRQKAVPFALEAALVYAEIAQICLVYLLELGLSDGFLDQAEIIEFPLSYFAALFWYHHYINAAGTKPRLNGLILEMFRRHQSCFST